MSKTGCIISHEGIEYLCGLIRDINGLDTNLIDDLNIKSNGTFSSVRINTLLNALKTDCNDYTFSLVSNLSRLELKIVTDESSIVDSNILYLHKPAGQNSYNQYVVIEGNKVLLGTTDINMSDYYTITQADNKFVLKTDFDTLTTEVDKVKTTLGNEALNTTSQTVTGAINELNDKSTMVTLTQAEYNQLVADGTVDADTYYIISDDSETIDLSKYNIKTYTSLDQIGLNTGCTMTDILNTLTDYSQLIVNSSYLAGSDRPLNSPSDELITITRLWYSRITIISTDKYGKMCTGSTSYSGTTITFNGWRRVYTTSVVDVKSTNITSRVLNVANSGSVSYSVKNGMCYVQFAGVTTTTTSTGQYILSTGSLPPVDTGLSNGHYPIASANSSNGLIVVEGNTGGVRYYGGAITFFTTVSYPVKES